MNSERIISASRLLRAEGYDMITRSFVDAILEKIPEYTKLNAENISEAATQFINQEDDKGHIYVIESNELGDNKNGNSWGHFNIIDPSTNNVYESLYASIDFEIDKKHGHEILYNIPKSLEAARAQIEDASIAIQKKSIQKEKQRKRWGKEAGMEI